MQILRGQVLGSSFGQYSSFWPWQECSWNCPLERWMWCLHCDWFWLCQAYEEDRNRSKTWSSCGVRPDLPKWERFNSNHTEEGYQARKISQVWCIWSYWLWHQVRDGQACWEERCCCHSEGHSSQHQGWRGAGYHAGTGPGNALLTQNSTALHYLNSPPWTWT